MSASNVVQISLDAGSTWTYTVIWKDAAGVPKSLSGYLARFQARKKAGAERPWHKSRVRYAPLGVS